MSRERHRARSTEEQAAIEASRMEGFDIVNAAETIRANSEANFWGRLTNMYLRFRAAGMHRQADIVQQDLQNELRRTDNKGQWSIENNQQPPAPKPIDWGDA